MTTENTKKEKSQSISHGLGVAGLIVGIVALIVSFIPCFGIFGIIIGFIGISISGIALAIALKHNHPKGIILGALITAILAFAIASFQYSAIASLGDSAIELQEELDKL